MHNRLFRWVGQHVMANVPIAWWQRACATVLMAVCLTGCGSERDTPGSGSKVDRHADPASPQRIVCGTPSVAEIVFALGVGDRVVGVSDYTVYPPKAKAKESIGGWINPSRERLLMVKPDIIITQGLHETLGAFADEYGIRFLNVKLDTLEDLYTATAEIAEALGVTERGVALNAGIRGKIKAVSVLAPRSPQAVAIKASLCEHGNVGAYGADTVTQGADLVFADGATLATLALGDPASVGIEIALPSLGRTDVVPRCMLGAQGALYLLENIINGLVRR